MPANLRNIYRKLASLTILICFAVADRCAGQIAAIPGVPWPNQPVTISFAPDHVEIGRYRNELFQHLNSQLGYPEWKIEILRAFQTWARHSNVQFALAADSPRAFGVPGLAQGDPRFGDIRIGAFPQNEVLGNAVPYNPVFGSWSGDIFLNTNETYTVDHGQSSNFGYDLYSVMLHEAGNALGLVDEMFDPTSVMFAYYVTTRSDLSPLDIANIQNLYGPPSSDPYEPASNNDSFARATLIPFGNQFATTLIATRQGRIQSSNDRDFYRFTGTSLSENCWVKLRARGKSLLVGRIIIYDAQFSEIARISAEDPIFNTVGKEITNIPPGHPIYVVVEAADDADFDFGDYELVLDFNASGGDELADDDDDGDDDFAGFFEQNDEALVDLLYSLAGIVDPEVNANNNFQTATLLIPVPGSAVASRYEVIGSLASLNDRDVYRLTAPLESTGTLSINLSPLGIDPVQLNVTVFDASRNSIPVTRRFRPTGDVVVEAHGIQPGQDYFVRVQGRAENTLTGNYLLVIDLTTKEASLVQLQRLQLSPANAMQYGELTTFKTQLFRFDLSMTPANANQACQLTIFSDSGRIEGVTSVQAGRTRTVYVWLPAGKHIVCFSARTRNGQAVASSTVILRGGAVSDDEGPILLDPSGNPVSGPQTPGNNPPPPPNWTFPRFITGLIIPPDFPW